MPPFHRAALPLALAAAALGADAQSPQQPPGADKTTKTRALEAGARLLQGNSPLGPMDVYLVGFHPMKDTPSTRWRPITSAIR